MAAPMRRRAFAAIAAVLGATVSGACGSASDDIFGVKMHDGGAADGATSGDDDASKTFTGLTDAALSADAFVACAADTEQAHELPLDLYFMLDTSGSMSDLVAPQKSKWSAVSSAMQAFVSDQASTGIGVGLQYFPLTQKGVATSCTSSTQCGSAGPCFLKACDITSINQIIPCDTRSDCPLGLSCDPIGLCSGDPNAVCPALAFGMACDHDANGFDIGTCQAVSSATCLQGDSCTVQDYATPAVPIALLPGAATSLNASLVAQKPNGGTPTLSALEGAIQQVKTYAAANPAHSVVAVLATDGEPDECTSASSLQAAVAEVAAAAAAGLKGSPSVKTFAIGVFAPNDISTGTTSLNEIAAAGGTSKAFIISATGNVEQQFLAALSAIRGASLPCQYAVPLPDGNIPDFTRVNVQYTSGTGVKTALPYVASAAACGSGSGWHYDVDPTNGATPSAIDVCPATCSTLQGDARGRVDVVIGCTTFIR
jgi:hypothetical protein